MSKMYIAVLDEVPDHMVPVLVAHAVLGAHLAFLNIPHELPEHEYYHTWLNKSFRKCVLRVNQKEFEKLSQVHMTFLASENTTLGGIKSCAVLCPRDEWPNVVKFAKLWKPMDLHRLIELNT